MSDDTSAPARGSSVYVHGTDPEEQRRLSRMNALINARCVEGIRVERGERVLDVGSGLGQLSRAIARRAGTRVLGVERSVEQIREAERQAGEEKGLVEFRAGDAGALPLGSEEWGTFDLVHARFVLEHVQDPLAVVKQMVKAARPGGRIVLEDDDHDCLRVWPDIPGLGAVWSAYQRTYDRIGCDPMVGRRLVSLLHEAGARPVRNQWVWFGACSGDGTLPDYTENLLGVIRSARDRMVGAGMVARDELDAFEERARAWSRREDAALWFAVSLAEGEKHE